MKGLNPVKSMGKLYKDYIKSYKLTKENSDGFLELMEELLSTEEIQSLKQYEQHLEIDRLQHILGVAFMSYKICRKFGWDYKAAARGGTMHDLVYYDWRDGETGGWHRLHGYYHPSRALMNARELCSDLTDKEADIIKKHMWPLTVVPPKYKEGFVVTFCDKYCATRELMYSLSDKYKQRFLSETERS